MRLIAKLAIGFLFIGIVLVIYLLYFSSQFTPSLKLPNQTAKTPEPSIDNNQYNTSPLKNANLLFRVVNTQNKPVNQGVIEVSVEYPAELNQHNYNYSTNLDSLLLGGLLALNPPPIGTSTTIKIRVSTPTGGKSDTLVMKNDEFWKAVSSTKDNFVTCHQFDLGKSGTVTNAVYTKECW